MVCVLASTLSSDFLATSTLFYFWQLCILTRCSVLTIRQFNMPSQRNGFLDQSGEGGLGFEGRTGRKGLQRQGETDRQTQT